MSLRYLFLLALTVQFSCSRPTFYSPTTDSLNRKSEPYDHATFQRTWPDTVFNWNAWRSTLQNIKTTADVAERSLSPCDQTSVSTAPWTLQGPSNVAGRVNTLAVKPDDENTILAGFAGGGIFKSTDAGVNWVPVFDENPELSIGAITFDPSNPTIAYAGTGDVNMPIILYNGDGVYKSTDAGNTWQFLGLSQAGIISEIIVHPTDPQTIWVSSMGNPYTRTDERGVYKTTNGGQTWQKVLFVSNQAGCSSLVLSKINPQILYASFWDRLRSNSESFVWGPHASVYKSVDGGNNWVKMSNGLPTGNNGRTGLAISQQNPDKVYVIFIDSLSTPGTMHLTSNGGQSWSSINIAALENACADFGWYFGKITLNPADDNDLYFHGILLHRRLSNGSWAVAAGGHADSHDLVFCPSGRRYWSNDGGVYRNEPGQQIWIKSKNLPATQVYRTSYNPHNPGEYWLGAQDNGIQRGNAQNINTWASVASADGFESLFHPTSPDTFWVETQRGNLSRTFDGGMTWGSTGIAFGTIDRVNWDAPIFRSKFPPYTFYAGTYRILASPDGSGFGTISDDLTDGPGNAPGFHTVTCVGESPLQAGKLLAGTSDANVWKREPSGSWQNITAGLPERYTTSVVGSIVSSQRIFVTQSGFRDNDDTPHIYRSDNNGQSWVSISGNLPPVPVNQLFIVPGHADTVLVAGTDAGAYATRNGGAQWYRLGSNMPAVPVFDFKHNIARKELVAATHGRSIWTMPLDSIGNLAPLSPVTTTVNGLVQTPAGLGTALVSFPELGTTVSTNTSGQYSAEVPGCTESILQPYRNDDPVNGVNAYDLILISRHILNIEPMDSPYKLIAADANRSGTVTSFDIVQLRKLILGSDTAFTQNTSWRFVPSDFDFDTPTNPFADSFPEQVTVSLEHQPVAAPGFTAIKIGDIDYSNIPGLSPVNDDRNLPNWPLHAHVALEEGLQTLTILGDLSQVAGMQFTIAFDPTVLAWQIPQCLAPDLDYTAHFNTKDAVKGLVTFVYEVPPGLTGVSLQPLFTLRFSVLQQAVELQNAVTISSARTQAFAFRPNGNPLKPVLRWPQLIQSSGLEVYPNPAPESGFQIQVKQAGEIRLLDVLGREVFRAQMEAGQVMHTPVLKPGSYWLIGNDKYTSIVVKR